MEMVFSSAIKSKETPMKCIFLYFILAIPFGRTVLNERVKSFVILNPPQAKIKFWM